MALQKGVQLSPGWSGDRSLVRGLTESFDRSIVPPMLTLTPYQSFYWTDAT